MAELYYFHDPMCSWCWGFRPIAARLFDSLPADVELSQVVGGLAADSNDLMPADQQLAIQAHWTRIASMLGTEFNFKFWTQCKPRRSTYPACRAVIAAGIQGSGEAMTFAIQRAYYLEARNPSDGATLIELAAELSLNVENFRIDFESSDTDTELRRQIGICHRHDVSSFPSLRLCHHGTMAAIAVDYASHSKMLNEIKNIIRK